MSSGLLISDAAKKVKVEAHVLRYWEEELGLPIKRNELGHRYYTEEDVIKFQEIKDLKERGLQLKAIRIVLKNGKLDMLGPVAKNSRAETSGTIEEKPGRSEDKTGIREDRIREDRSRAKDEREDISRVERDIPRAREDRSTFREAEKAEAVRGSYRYEAAEVEMYPEEGSEQYSIMNKRERSLQSESGEEKAKRLQWLLQQLFRETLRENNEHLCREMKESMLKEMDYQFRMQEEREEERDTKKVKRDEEHFRKIDELLRKKRKLLK